MISKVVFCMGIATVITSGKGGVGKSTAAVGLGRALAARGRRVLLTDDVLTTGSTLAACVQALEEAGAASVVCVTLAAGHG